VFAHAANASSADRLVVSVQESGGARTPVFTKTGSAADVDGAWRNAYALLDAWKGQTIRIHIEAVDGAANSTVEAQIDDLRIMRGS
jgi:aminopeptidase S